MPSFYPENNTPAAGDPTDRILNKILSVLLGGGSGGSGSEGGASVSGASGALTDGSGTITTGGTAQTVFAANADRKYLFIQNVSNEDMHFDFGVAAVQDQPSVLLKQNDSFVMESGFVSDQSISIIATTTGSKFVAKEG